MYLRILTGVTKVVSKWWDFRRLLFCSIVFCIFPFPFFFFFSPLCLFLILCNKWEVVIFFILGHISSWISKYLWLWFCFHHLSESFVRSLLSAPLGIICHLCVYLRAAPSSACLFFSSLYILAFPLLTSWGGSCWSDWQWIKIKNTSWH